MSSGIKLRPLLSLRVSVLRLFLSDAPCSTPPHPPHAPSAVRVDDFFKLHLALQPPPPPLSQKHKISRRGSPKNTRLQHPSLIPHLPASPPSTTLSALSSVFSSTSCSIEVHNRACRSPSLDLHPTQPHPPPRDGCLVSCTGREIAPIPPPPA